MPHLKWCGWLLMAVLAAAGLRPAQAAGDPTRRDWQVSLYVGQFLKGTLLELPSQFVQGELGFRSATFFQLDLGYTPFKFDLPIPFCTGCALRNNQFELHAAVGQYAGRQTNAELGAYFMFRTGQIGPRTGLQANIAAGWGISYATGTTGLEVGRTDIQGVDTYRTQFQVPIEVEWWHPNLRSVSIVLPRIHHRSGGYGALAAYGSGSNFIGGSLRLSW
ncbi:hypothetical protein [Roseococcus sp. YIM B11640]|uniref:hypothetical protein n=1 Tax=Roseococcus sp. YIM B11640 TaxID=3133973 RepID=UPI003C7DD49D